MLNDAVSFTAMVLWMGSTTAENVSGEGCAWTATAKRTRRMNERGAKRLLDMTAPPPLSLL